MPWFKVDDTLAYHPKVLQAGNVALGLWLRAGAYCAQQLTDGFVPNDVLVTLGTRSQAARLVSAGLWESVPGGFRFHDWSQYQPTRADVEKERAAAKERQARWRAGKRRNGVTNATTNAVTDSVTNGVSNASHGDATPSRPDPTLSPLTPRGHVASLLGWAEDDERLDHLDDFLQANNVRAPRAWIARCHEAGDLERNLTEYAQERRDPWAGIPWVGPRRPPGGPAS